MLHFYKVLGSVLSVGVRNQTEALYTGIPSLIASSSYLPSESYPCIRIQETDKLALVLCS